MKLKSISTAHPLFYGEGHIYSALGDERAKNCALSGCCMGETVASIEWVKGKDAVIKWWWLETSIDSKGDWQSVPVVRVTLVPAEHVVGYELHESER